MDPDQRSALPPVLNDLGIALRVAPGSPSPSAALEEISRRGGRAVLHLTSVPAPEDPLLTTDATVLAIETSGGDLDRLAFDLKRALSAARGHRSSSRLLVAAPDDVVAGLRDRGVTPYLDAFVAPSSAIADAADLLTPLAGDALVIRVLPREMPAASTVLRTAATVAPWFPAGLVSVPDRPLHCGGETIPAFLNPQTLDLVALSRSCPPSTPVTSDVSGVITERLEAGGVYVFRVPGVAGGDRFAEGVIVGAARSLTADEIIVRHQAFAARQAAAITSDIAEGTLTLTFEAPGFVAPVTITARTTVFKDAARTDMRQADVRVNGVPFAAKDGVPRLPILEPERVAVLPLTITLSSVYRYELEGRDTVDGRSCYRIGFTPQAAGESLFSGRAWIDERTFALVRVSAAQTGLKGAIVASEQTDTFATDADGRWLLARSDIRQTYEGASVRTPIHRLLTIDRHEVDAPGFAARRDAAYASTDVILRDTPEGFRYLKREVRGETTVLGKSEPRPGESAAAVTRTPVPAITHVRTLAMGVIVDPNISIPLPFAGLSYVDFDLFHTGTQFSGFFGGSYGQLAFSAPSVAGTRWQIAGRAFGIAASYNDRAFEAGREIYAQDIRQQPAQAAVWALRPVGARAALRFEYDWDYNRFSRNDETDPAFIVPRNQNAHGLRVGLDVQSAGWQTSLWVSDTIRLGWRPWGIATPDGDASSQSSFQRIGATVQRTAALSPRVAARVEASFVSGRHMDRFSRIAFGTFDNRLHGYPSALIRYDRGGVFRSSLSWTAAKAIRLDGFADTSFVHDPAFGRGLKNFTGFGAALEVPAPFGTLAAIEWGFGVQGVNTNGDAGTHVLRITAYKVF